MRAEVREHGEIPNPYRRKLACAMESGQLHRVPAISLNPVARPTGDHEWRDHNAYVDGPRLTIELADYDRSLAFICPASKVQPQMTAGQDGIRGMSSKQVSGICLPLHCTECLLPGLIDPICAFYCKSRPQLNKGACTSAPVFRQALCRYVA